MKKMVWQVEYTSTPPVVKYCKKCNTKTSFISSDLFRVNASRKSLDIWLIYRCEHCDYTWNMTIYTRVNPASIARELLEQFHRNDGELAKKCAMDLSLLKRNGVEAGLPEYQIIGEAFEITSPTELIIRAPYASGIKVAKVIRRQLGISSKELEQAIEKKEITTTNNNKIKKLTLQTELTLLFIPSN